MTEILESQWWGVLGLILTLIFGVLAVVFYIRGRRFKVLEFEYSTALLQTQAHPDVMISFRGRPVTNLAQLLVLCWNAGTDAIRSADIPVAHPPQIVFEPGTAILSKQVTSKSREALDFAVAQSGVDTLSVQFEYLNPGDGAVVEVLFENQTTRRLPLSFRAEIIGARPTRIRPYETRQSWFDLSITVGFPLAICVWLSFGAARVLISRPTIAAALLATGLLILAGGAAYAVWLNVSGGLRQRRRPRFARALFEGT